MYISPLIIEGFLAPIRDIILAWRIPKEMKAAGGSKENG